MRIQLLCLLMAGIASQVCRAEDAKPRQTAEAFLTRVGKSEIAPAYDDLFAGSPVVAEKAQAVEAVKRQTAAGLPLYGKALGFSLQNEKAFGDSLVRLTYIQKFEKHPIVWRFWFYRPSDKWYIDSVVFNDQFGFLNSE